MMVLRLLLACPIMGKLIKNVLIVLIILQLLYLDRHLLAGTIKDTVTRYAHQTGHYVSRRFGWDCHGLPVEYEIDKKLNITGRDMVLEMGIANYNNECRSIVQRYTAEWEKTVTRLGRWIDFENDYKTMDPEFMESVWWVFKTLFEKDLVYRGYKVMPFSTACGTPLSNFEAGLNYKDVNDPAIVVSFPVVDQPDTHFLAWTTTPWTLPSNLALCVNPEYEYIKIQDKVRGRKCYILEKRLGQLFPEVNKSDITDERRAELYEILERVKGSSLVGMKYVPLFPYFENLPTAFRVAGDSYVTDDSGTGIVHQAPAFGEDDYRVCIAHGIVQKGEGLPCPVDSNGRFTSEVPEFVGRNVKEADGDIIALLKSQGRLVSKEVYNHSYPFCWRSDTPLIYKAVPSWFVAVEKVKPRLLHNNSLTYWVPGFVKEGRFHNWLADAKDWAISRNRFWGTPIPLWCSEDFEEMVAIGSVQELYEKSGVLVSDLHKENVDHITIPSSRGKGVLRRIDEVFDCWFESGSMPYAQLHYPFENQDRFEKGFPADFIAEGLDQTRGWFYTLTVIATCLFDKPAFKNLIVNGLVLAGDGKKMSKRLKNYPDPNDVVNSYGADALRLYLINSPVVRADVLKFQEEGANEIVRGVFLPWFNAFRFFIQCVERYERSSGTPFVPQESVAKSSTNDLDIWVMASCSSLVDFVHQEMKAYRLYTVVPRLLGFIEELTNWFVRLNRDRLKGSNGEEDAFQGLNVLSDVLNTMTLIMSPFTPFFCEYLYQHLRKLSPNYPKEGAEEDSSVPVDTFGKSESVHFLMLPTVDASQVNQLAVDRFKVLQQAVTIVRIARERRHIRNNLPLKHVVVVSNRAEDIEALEYLRGYFMSEINAWDVTMTTEFDKMCSLKVIPNWKDLGKRLGKKMKEVAKAISDLKHEEIVEFMQRGVITLCGFDLNKEDLVVKREFNGDAKKYEAGVSDDGALLVAIDTTCDEDVLCEMRARSMAAAVQRLRKAAGLVVNDQVEVFFEEGLGDNACTSTGSLAEALKKHASSTIKRIKVLPLPRSLMSTKADVVVQEVFEDADMSKHPVTITLSRPKLAVHEEEVSNAVRESLVEAENIMEHVAQAVDFLHSLTYEDMLNGDDVVHFEIQESRIPLRRGVHFYPTMFDMILNRHESFVNNHPHLPHPSNL